MLYPRRGRRELLRPQSPRSASKPPPFANRSDRSKVPAMGFATVVPPDTAQWRASRIVRSLGGWTSQTKAEQKGAVLRSGLCLPAPVGCWTRSCKANWTQSLLQGAQTWETVRSKSCRPQVYHAEHLQKMRWTELVRQKSRTRPLRIKPSKLQTQRVRKPRTSTRATMPLALSPSSSPLPPPIRGPPAEPRAPRRGQRRKELANPPAGLRLPILRLPTWPSAGLPPGAPGPPPLLFDRRRAPACGPHPRVWAAVLRPVPATAASASRVTGGRASHVGQSRTGPKVVLEEGPLLPANPVLGRLEEDRATRVLLICSVSVDFAEVGRQELLLLTARHGQHKGGILCRTVFTSCCWQN